MVERIESKGFDEFEGIVKAVEITDNDLQQDAEGKALKQYKVTIATEASSTGFMYEWINISSKATEIAVPEGSNLDKFLIELEMVHKEVKSIEKIYEALAVMIGKKYLFKKKRLGKSYDGKEAKEFWIPVSVIE